MISREAEGNVILELRAMGKKELLANLLYHSGLWRPVSRLRPNGLVILNYHRIRQDHTTEPCLLDDAIRLRTPGEMAQSEF
jgi:hypothetical protein